MSDVRSFEDLSRGVPRPADLGPVVYGPQTEHPRPGDRFAYYVVAVSSRPGLIELRGTAGTPGRPGASVEHHHPSSSLLAHLRTRPALCPIRSRTA